MKFFTVHEAQELAAFATQTLQRLARAEEHARAALAMRSEERAWLARATARVTAGVEKVRAALGDAAPLPEFEHARKLSSEALSHAWADAVERVFDGIVENVSANGPLIEALFPHQRFAALRRPGSAARNFWQEFERRAESSYVKRLAGDPEYEFLAPLLEAAKASEIALTQASAPRVLPEARALALREGVSTAAEALELALRQARALAEAALAETPEALAELGLDAKPKRLRTRAGI